MRNAPDLTPLLLMGASNIGGDPGHEMPPPNAPPPDPDDVLAYLADMISELKVMAFRLGLATLAGILDLAETEAKLHQRRTGTSP